jgi:hypothetical protein
MVKQEALNLKSELNSFLNLYKFIYWWRVKFDEVNFFILYFFKLLLKEPASPPLSK